MLADTTLWGTNATNTFVRLLGKHFPECKITNENDMAFDYAEFADKSAVKGAQGESEQGAMMRGLLEKRLVATNTKIVYIITQPDAQLELYAASKRANLLYGPEYVWMSAWITETAFCKAIPKNTTHCVPDRDAFDGALGMMGFVEGQQKGTLQKNYTNAVANLGGARAANSVDSVLAFALAADRIISENREISAEAIYTDLVQHVSPFDGVSGDQIKLDKSTGDRISSMWLYRYQLREPAEAANWTTTDSAVPLKDFDLVVASLPTKLERSACLAQFDPSPKGAGILGATPDCGRGLDCEAVFGNARATNARAEPCVVPLDGTERGSSDESGTLAVWAVVAVIVAIVLCALAWSYARERAIRNRPHNFVDEVQHLKRNLPWLDGEEYAEAAPEIALPREIRRKHVRLVDKIGSGAFGSVWKAKLDEADCNLPGGMTVAAKVATTSEDADAQSARSSLYKEAVVTAHLSGHTNVVALLGVVTVCRVLSALASSPFRTLRWSASCDCAHVCAATPGAVHVSDAGTAKQCTRSQHGRRDIDVDLEFNPAVFYLFACMLSQVGDPAMLLVSYCEHGSLLSQLRERASRNDAVSIYAKLRGALQVCCGMAFLAQKKIVHRDLATRNILVDVEWQCLIADFGLSRETQGEDFYQASDQGMFPVRWTAPEAMRDMRFTEASVSWSFGIVMVEMYQDGELPYEQLPYNNNVIFFVEKGERIGQDALEGCTDEVYAILLNCWDCSPENRPRFAQLVQLFTGLLQRYRSDTLARKPRRPPATKETNMDVAHAQSQAHGARSAGECKGVAVVVG